jgi:hypothetical protein
VVDAEWLHGQGSSGGWRRVAGEREWLGVVDAEWLHG